MIPYLMTGIYSQHDVKPVLSALNSLQVEKVYLELRPNAESYFNVVDERHKIRQKIVPCITLHGGSITPGGLWDYVNNVNINNVDSLYTFERFQKIHELMSSVCGDFHTTSVGIINEPDPIQTGMYPIDYKRLSQLYQVLGQRRRMWYFDQPTYTKPSDRFYIQTVEDALTYAVPGMKSPQRPKFMPLEPLRTGQFDPTLPEFIFWNKYYPNRAHYRMAVSIKGNPQYPWTAENVAKVLAYWRSGISRLAPILYVATPEITEVCNELRRIL